MPEQSSATGWVNGVLYTLIFEVREDEEGEFYWLVTLWKATPREGCCMPKMPDAGTPVDAERIAEMADAGEDVSRFFVGKGKMEHPITIQRVSVDFTVPMLEELDRAAEQLNVTRQAVIKSMLRHSLDQHYLASARQLQKA